MLPGMDWKSSLSEPLCLNGPVQTGRNGIPEPVASIIFIKKRARLDCNKKYKINEISACNYDLTVLIYLLHGKKSGAENKKL